jgi:ParB/RepB/Spo0J family partition protein
MTEIDLNNIVTNSDNSREPAPTLQGLGYGIVEPIEGADKPSLFALALGEHGDRARYRNLVERYEESLVDLAESIGRQGQLQNCRVRPAGEGKYALTFGARRCLAVLYLHARHGRPAKVGATVSEADGKTAVAESAAENIHLPPSYIDQARLFKRLRDQGLTVKQIAKVCPMGKATEQNIRHRLRLLELPPEVQIKVHHGKLSQDAALKMLAMKDVENNETPQEPPAPEPEGEGTYSEVEPQQGPESSAEEPQPDGEPHREEQGAKEEASAGRDAGLRAILESFIDRMGEFDLDHFSPDNPAELRRLAHQAQKRLAAIRGKLSKARGCGPQGQPSGCLGSETERSR